MTVRGTQLPALVCPNCRNPLDDNGPDQLQCPRCRAVYPLVDGIPSFMPQTARISSPAVDLTVILPFTNEANLEPLVARVRNALASLGITAELIEVDQGARPGSPGPAESTGARRVRAHLPGYGGALRSGFEEAHGRYVLTMHADGSHDLGIIDQLWQARLNADVVIASRYIPGGAAVMPLPRRVLSRTFNAVARRALSLPAHDISSGFRLYDRRVLDGLELKSTGYDVLEEIVIRALAAGFTLHEVPLRYVASGGRANQLRGFAFSTLRTFGSMWKLRNSIASADYDARAYDSIVPLQRYWQRRRHRVITRASAGATSVLDVGCGSSRILLAHRDGIGLDVQLHKLRYARRYGNPLVHGSIFALPFADESFDCVICSEVIEHIPADERVLSELTRVLRPGGRLILGTPDYDRWRWRALEWAYGKMAPGGYADEHITNYGQAQLREELERRRLKIERLDYVGGAEMIFTAVKTRG